MSVQWGLSTINCTVISQSSRMWQPGLICSILSDSLMFFVIMAELWLLFRRSLVSPTYCFELANLQLMRLMQLSTRQDVFLNMFRCAIMELVILSMSVLYLQKLSLVQEWKNSFLVLGRGPIVFFLCFAKGFPCLLWLCQKMPNILYWLAL